jgi:hypothetical protein
MRYIRTHHSQSAEQLHLTKYIQSKEVILSESITNDNKNTMILVKYVLEK